MPAGVHIVRWRGEPGVELRAGDLDATFLPDCGMLGVSLRHRGQDFVALPHLPAGWRAGHTTGIPLLHPWANRLGARSYTVGDRRVRLSSDIHTDGNGLPIHGTVPNASFRLQHVRVAGRAAELQASLSTADDERLARAFPFPHELTISARLDERALQMRTTVVPTSDAAVPVSFGWHPYFKVPGARRRHWTLRLPARTHVALGADQLPTGAHDGERASTTVIGSKTFDDHYRLGRDRRFEIATDTHRLRLRFGPGYDFAQVYAPPGREFIAIEPMTATVDALRRGTTRTVAPGDRFTATFSAAPSAR